MTNKQTITAQNDDLRMISEKIAQKLFELKELKAYKRRLERERKASQWKYWHKNVHTDMKKISEMDNILCRC